MTGIRGLSLGAVGPNSRPGGPPANSTTQSQWNLLLLAAFLSLAGPERAAEAHGPSLSWPAHCQGSAFRGMYGQDGTLHFTDAGKGNGENFENQAGVCGLLQSGGRTTSCCLCIKTTERWMVKLLRGEQTEHEGNEHRRVVCFWFTAA